MLDIETDEKVARAPYKLRHPASRRLAHELLYNAQLIYARVAVEALLSLMASIMRREATPW